MAAETVLVPPEPENTAREKTPIRNIHNQIMQWEQELQSFSEEKENEVSGELTRKSKKNEEEKWLGRRKEDSPGNLGAPNSYRSPGMNDEEEEKMSFLPLSLSGQTPKTSRLPGVARTLGEDDLSVSRGN